MSLFNKKKPPMITINKKNIEVFIDFEYILSKQINDENIVDNTNKKKDCNFDDEYISDFDDDNYYIKNDSKKRKRNSLGNSLKLRKLPKKKKNGDIVLNINFNQENIPYRHIINYLKWFKNFCLILKNSFLLKEIKILLNKPINFQDNNNKILLIKEEFLNIDNEYRLTLIFPNKNNNLYFENLRNDFIFILSSFTNKNIIVLDIKNIPKNYLMNISFDIIKFIETKNSLKHIYLDEVIDNDIENDDVIKKMMENDGNFFNKEKFFSLKNKQLIKHLYNCFENVSVIGTFGFFTLR